VTSEHRIHGPPGTGKTTTLATWVHDAAARFGPERVLVSSFTRAAAAELHQRGLDVPRENVGTLHSICYHALGRPALTEDHLDEWNEYAPWLALSAGRKPEDDAVQPRESPTDADATYQLVQRLRGMTLPVERWPQHAQDFWREWYCFKFTRGLLDFSDLIEQAARRFQSAPRDFAVGFFDEAQDLAPLELALVRQWSESMEFVVLVGDADQCIYEWAGCSPRAFLEPPIPAEHNRVLGQSHRVPRAVHAVARRVIERCSYRFPSEYLPRDAGGEVSHVEPMRAGAYWLPQFVESQAGTTMVLATCAYMLGPALRALRDAGMPFHNPYRKTNGAWNPMRGGVERLRALLVADRRAVGDAARTWTWTELHRWVDWVDADHLKHGAKTWAAQKAKAREAKDEVVTNDEVNALLPEETLRSLICALNDGDPCAWLREHALASHAAQLDYGCAVSRARGTTAMFQPPRVIVGTVHSVKGAEADAVVLAPDLSRQAHERWLSSAEDRDAVLRVMYVGATRARESLALCAPSSWSHAEEVFR
jgi:superfamily I DNA/RNA helicase